MFRAILHWFLTHGLMIMFAAGGAALPSAGGTGDGSGSGGDGTGGSPSSATGAPGGSPTPSSDAAPASGQGTPGQGNGSIDWTTAPAHFRTAYEKQQAELARWTGLGVDHDIASTYVQTTRQMIGEAYQVGRQLQYSDQDIQEALSKDLVGTLSFLRSAAAKAGQNGQGNGQGQGQGGQRPGQVDPSIQKLIDQRLSPIEEHTNRAMAEAANHAFTGEFDRLFSDHYKADAQSVPKEVRDLIFDAVSEVFKYNDKGLHALKFARDTSAIADTFRQVLGRFEVAMNAYHMQQLKKSGTSQGGGRPGSQAGQGGSQDQNQGWEGMTLDDIAQGNERAVKLIPSMR